MLTSVDVSVSSNVKIKLAIAGSGNEICVKIRFKDIHTVNAVFNLILYYKTFIFY